MRNPAKGEAEAWCRGHTMPCGEAIIGGKARQEEAIIGKGRAIVGGKGQIEVSPGISAGPVKSFPCPQSQSRVREWEREMESFSRNHRKRRI